MRGDAWTLVRGYGSYSWDLAQKPILCDSVYLALPVPLATRASIDAVTLEDVGALLLAAILLERLVLPAEPGGARASHRAAPVPTALAALQAPGRAGRAPLRSNCEDHTLLAELIGCALTVFLPAKMGLALRESFSFQARRVPLA